METNSKREANAEDRTWYQRCWSTEQWNQVQCSASLELKRVAPTGNGQRSIFGQSISLQTGCDGCTTHVCCRFATHWRSILSTYVGINCSTVRTSYKFPMICEAGGGRSWQIWTEAWRYADSNVCERDKLAMNVGYTQSAYITLSNSLTEHLKKGIRVNSYSLTKLSWRIAGSLNKLQFTIFPNLNNNEFKHWRAIKKKKTLEINKEDCVLFVRLASVPVLLQHKVRKLPQNENNRKCEHVHRWQKGGRTEVPSSQGLSREPLFE